MISENDMRTLANEKFLSFILVILMLSASVLLCSCGDSRFSNMKKYANDNSKVNVVSIYMVGNKSDEEERDSNKQVLIGVTLDKNKQHYSIEELESLRIALNDYMTNDPNSYINQGYSVVIWVENSFYSPTTGPISRCAVFSNLDTLYLESSTEINNSLCTAMYKPYEKDVPMLCNISGIKYLWLIDEGYSTYHEDGFPIDEINDVIADIKDLQVLYIDENYFERLDSTSFSFEVKEGTY